MRAEAVALAQDDGEERHADVGAHDEHPGGVAHQRGFFDFRPHHDARGIAQEEQWQVERIAQLHEASGLVGAVAIDRAGQMNGVVGDHAERAPLDPDQRGHHPEPKWRRNSSTEPVSASVSITARTS